jgi:simple sugar transport system permease protein
MMKPWIRRFTGVIGTIISVAFLLYIYEKIGLSPKSILQTTFLALTPLLLAALGETINEKGGLVNIGLEGILLMTAVLGVYFAEITHSGWYGLILGALLGGFIGFIFGVISVYGKADQIVVGIGLNLFALGFVQFFMMAVWAMPGIRIPPKEVIIPPTTISGFRISLITIVSIMLAPIIHYLINKTKFGLWLRAAGEAPESLDAAGVSVEKIRITGATIGGLLTGLGGAYMSLAWFGGVVKEITAGRGFIALAIMVASGLRPLYALLFSFIFGFAEATAIAISLTPGVKEVVPYHLILMIPYIVTLATVSIFMGRARFPKALGIPYRRE